MSDPAPNLTLLANPSDWYCLSLLGWKEPNGWCGILAQDQMFASLFPHNGRAVEAPWRLALITVLQFMEELPDRQAADAVRGRTDSTHVLAKIRAINRHMCVGEARRFALNSLAVVAPEWLLGKPAAAGPPSTASTILT